MARTKNYYNWPLKHLYMALNDQKAQPRSPFPGVDKRRAKLIATIQAEIGRKEDLYRKSVVQASDVLPKQSSN